MDLETLKIDLKGLKEGANHLTFDLDDTYFKAIDAPEVSQGRVHVSLDIVRTGNDFVAWYLYEFIALAIPIKHVHAPGKCNPAMVRALEEHSAARSGQEDEQPMDPRWEALLKLKK